MFGLYMNLRCQISPTQLPELKPKLTEDEEFAVSRDADRQLAWIPVCGFPLCRATQSTRV